jgi:hypothetical protein
MGAIGAALAAVWLRYRAPVNDRHALGPLGVPAIAVSVAALLVIAGAVGETFMAAGLWLAWVTFLSLLGLVLLRRAIHVGLLEEADEIETGPPITCANCDAATATHTFCGNCGIALKALPKVRGADEERRARRGSFAGRFAQEPGVRRAGYRRRGVYAIAIAAIVGAGFAIGALAAPPAPQPVCGPHRQCGSPPVLPHALRTFPGYAVWQSAALGYSLRYGVRDWQLASQGSTGAELQSADGFSVLIVNAIPQSQASPLTLGSQTLAALKGQLLGLAPDTDPSDVLLGPEVGLRQGTGGVFQATVSSPLGPETPVSIALMAAGDGRVSIVATVIAPADDRRARAAVYAKADDVINSIEWSPR